MMPTYILGPPGIRGQNLILIPTIYPTGSSSLAKTSTWHKSSRPKLDRTDCVYLETSATSLDPEDIFTGNTCAYDSRRVSAKRPGRESRPGNCSPSSFGLLKVSVVTRLARIPFTLYSTLWKPECHARHHHGSLKVIFSRRQFFAECR